MPRNALIFHLTLARDAVADALLRSIDIEVAQQSWIPWFIRLIWKGGNRPFRGVVDGNTFRFKRRNARQFAPNFYGKGGLSPAEPESKGTWIWLLQPGFRFLIRSRSYRAYGSLE